VSAWKALPSKTLEKVAVYEEGTVKKSRREREESIQTALKKHHEAESSAVTDSMGEEQAVLMAYEIAANGSVAIRASKEAIHRGMTVTAMKEALEIERQCYARVLPTKDRLEGLAAFQEGRNPNYRGE
jgi:1,4-dihydroxy-2-naphthoyl-CoA synthase